jgi:aminotransferase EvaB
MLNKVLLFQMDRKISKHRREIDNAISEVLNSSSFILGEKLVQFEEEFAKYIGVDRAVGVANGTDAIELAIRSIDLSLGSKVATVANAANYSSSAIRAAGHTPVYMDIDSSTQLTNFKNVVEAIELGANAVILTHLYGAVVNDIVKIVEYCKRRDIPVIEDCAQAHGASLENRKAGSFGDVAAFSFYPTKNLGALGDAGLVASSNNQIIARLEMLRNYGWADKYKIEVLGGRNSRMDELQAAILSKLLPYLSSENNTREAYAAQIQREVRNQDLRFLKVSGVSSWHLMIVMTDNRDDLVRHLEARGIQTGIHYPVLDSHQIGCQQYPRCNSLANSLDSVGRILTLPISPYLREDEIHYLIKSLNDFSANI